MFCESLDKRTNRFDLNIFHCIDLTVKGFGTSSAKTYGSYKVLSLINWDLIYTLTAAIHEEWIRHFSILKKRSGF